MYRQFLIYRGFYTAEKPVILCEGKTDNVYINSCHTQSRASIP